MFGRDVRVTKYPVDCEKRLLGSYLGIRTLTPGGGYRSFSSLKRTRTPSQRIRFTSDTTDTPFPPGVSSQGVVGVIDIIIYYIYIEKKKRVTTQKQKRAHTEYILLLSSRIKLSGARDRENLPIQSPEVSIEREKAKKGFEN